MASNFGYRVGLLGFARVRNLIAHVDWFKAIEIRHYHIIFFVSALSLASAPLRLLESLLWASKIKQTKIINDPVFILGHWRSGTTHLHNLLVQDQDFGYISMYQSIAPECSLIGGRFLYKILKRIFPVNRPMDNMIWPLDSPQEDEFPLCKIFPWTFYLCLLFPRHYQTIFNKSANIHLLSTYEKTLFKEAYLRVLSIATLRSGGKRLILKNPINTARIKILLEMFPNAKFIYIARNPYDVYYSTIDLVTKFIKLIGLQALSAEEIKELTLDNYEILMQSYLRDKHLIPQGQFVETRFEQLESDPMTEIQNIYEKLEMEFTPTARANIESYIRQQSSYKKNKHKTSNSAQQLVNTRWGFSFQPLDYKILPAQMQATVD